MYIGRVIGTVVSTIKDKTLVGYKLLVVDRLGLDGKPDDHYFIAIDVAQAGVGDKVIVIDEGSGARQIMRREIAPVRAVVVGIIDDIEMEE
jgi:ethanolamine utilization protein EutN